MGAGTWLECGVVDVDHWKKGLRAASVLSGLGEGRASGWMLMIMLAWQARMVQGV